MKAGTLPGEDLATRWERIGLGVRCAYNPQRPEVLQHCVQSGRRLSQLRPAQEVRIQRRMLDLLLHTAGDEALPWHWRAACLEQTAWPLARLGSLQPRGSAEGEQVPDERVHEAWERLGPAPRSVRSAAGSPGSLAHGSD